MFRKEMILQAVLMISAATVPISVYAKNDNEKTRIRVTQKNKSTLKKVVTSYEKASKNVASVAKDISHKDIKESFEEYSEKYKRAAKYMDKQIRKDKAIELNKPKKEKEEENGKDKKENGDDDNFKLNDTQKAQLLQAADHLDRAAREFDQLAKTSSQKDARILKSISDGLQNESQHLREIQEKGALAATTVTLIAAGITAAATGASAAVTTGSAIATATS